VAAGAASGSTILFTAASSPTGADNGKIEAHKVTTQMPSSTA